MLLKAKNSEQCLLYCRKDQKACAPPRTGALSGRFLVGTSPRPVNSIIVPVRAGAVAAIPVMTIVPMRITIMHWGDVSGTGVSGDMRLFLLRERPPKVKSGRGREGGVFFC